MMLHPIIWLREHVEEGRAVQGCFLAKQGGPIRTGGREARKDPPCPRKQESMHVSWCRLQGKFGDRRQKEESICATIRRK